MFFTVPTAEASVSPTAPAGRGLESTRLKVSEPSSIASSRSVTDTVPVVVPGGNVRVPAVEAKSVPAVAVPLTVR